MTCEVPIGNGRSVTASGASNLGLKKKIEKYINMLIIVLVSIFTEALFVSLIICIFQLFFQPE